MEEGVERKRRTLFIVGACSRYLHDSFGSAICSLSSRDSGGDLAEVAGPAGPLLYTEGWAVRMDGWVAWEAKERVVA